MVTPERLTEIRSHLKEQIQALNEVGDVLDKGVVLSISFDDPEETVAAAGMVLDIQEEIDAEKQRDFFLNKQDPNLN